MTLSCSFFCIKELLSSDNYSAMSVPKRFIALYIAGY